MADTDKEHTCRLFSEFQKLKDLIIKRIRTGGGAYFYSGACMCVNYDAYLFKENQHGQRPVEVAW